MGVYSDQLNPQPFQPVAASPDIAGSKPVRIRQLANQAKQRGAQKMLQFRQLTSGAALPKTAGRMLVEKHDEIDQLVRKALFG